jgi:hypothetical protein
MESIVKTLNDLFVTYNDNPYMLQRLNTHLANLPIILDQESKKYDERVSRINELISEQENFYKVFLSKHQYYYMPYNNIYYEYDGKSYKIVKDDDIHHNLLSTITDEGKLTQWKHKTKQQIIKQIKERSLFKSTPETYTIQNVLGFLQSIFPSKNDAKYFLTIIGDCIQKKNTENLLYFVSTNAKKIIAIIDYIGYLTTGNSIMNNFITKFHDSHKLSQYRLIKTNEITNIDMVKDILNNIGIDFLCVAAHYSDRYTNSDNYLKSKTENSIQNYVLYFSDNSMEKIVDEFVSQCIEVNSGSNISWKNMHYIWKLYLSSINIPNMIYSNSLQNILSAKLTHAIDNGNIIFINLTSKYLPNVSSFLTFWEKYVSISLENNNDEEYEIDELSTLYKNSDLKNSQLSDINMIKMIAHYFSPQVEIIDNKYITNIKCNLWSKHDDIDEFLLSYKSNLIQIGVDPDLLVSFDDLYQGYKTFFKAKGLIEQKSLPIVSKQFFEKFLSNQLQLYIKFDKFISSEWLQN